MPMQAILIRHGQAASNLQVLDRLVGEYATLTAEGKHQIQELSTMLGRILITRTIFTSPYPRTMQSADILAEALGLQIVVDERLQEIQKGDWEGKPVREVIELEAAVDIDQRPMFRPPHGENWQDVGDRVAELIEELRQRDHKQVLLMSHDHPIRMGIGKLLAKPIASWEDLRVDNASIHILEYANGAWEISKQPQ